MKEKLYGFIDGIEKDITTIADEIFDNPELGLKEYRAAKLLTDYLEANGFTVEKGIYDIETAFKATFKNDEGTINIGLLCEYDALEGLGHACAHHMQGPAIVAAALALKKNAGKIPFTITIYGTPAEETVSGKIMMISRGCTFKELDVALMMHGSGETQTDVKSLAMSKFTVTYKGIASHAAVKPESGRSALDGLILAFQGIEFLREHVGEGVKMHYTILDCGGTAANIVPAKATASFYVRSYSRTQLDSVIERFKKVLQGAAMMTETEVEIITDKAVDNKVPAIKLNEIVMENAVAVGAPRIKPPREKTGSTDFGNVLHRVPGTCIRVAFVDEEIASHSQGYLDKGKSDEAHKAIIYGAKILAGAAADLIENPELLKEIKEEFNNRLSAEG